jgi:NAD(P)-dependent dehydrogenase (short-subunit alcohol dehydrogenase family)
MKNKIVVITGGAGNIGKAAAKRFSALGARVFLIVRRDIDTANQIILELPNQEIGHRAFLASITDTAAIRTVVSEIKKNSGQVDLLINTAGITKTFVTNKDLSIYTDEIIDEIFINNVRGTLAVIREFADLLKISGDGLVINITSASALKSSPSNIVYGASKAALELLTKSLSKSLAPQVRVVSVCPGILEHSTSGGWKPAGWNEKMAQDIPLGRVGTADDVVATIEALATTMKYITGSSILLDGGKMS